MRCAAVMKERMAGAIRRKVMIDQLQTFSGLQAPLRAQDLSPGQRSLVELMHLHQFGRIENMPVRGGQPILDRDVKVVRVARLGGESDPLKLTNAEEFELKRQIRDLFHELARLENGTVVRLEFRHGLPFLLETTPSAVSGTETTPPGFAEQSPKVGRL